RIAIDCGLRYVYTGNVHDPQGGSTWCHKCGELLIGRDWYELSTWNIRTQGGLPVCGGCGADVAGVFEELPGNWGSRRMPIHIAA
ncbi:MAG: AmmeMemoRadiSam system radical SAM enzyme, partial [Gammaproteobacteria bacterium]|nr:AmmeMemoRadiSam system radical SAM enzyme [Gammaproteobacteria bacterium]